MFDTPLPPAYDTTNAISFQLEVEVHEFTVSVRVRVSDKREDGQLRDIF